MPNGCILKFCGYIDEADLFGFKILIFFFFFFFFFRGGGGGGEWVRKYENLFW